MTWFRTRFKSYSMPAQQAVEVCEADRHRNINLLAPTTPAEVERRKQTCRKLRNREQIYTTTVRE